MEETTYIQHSRGPQLAESRFQVRPMLSPADRAGKAHVHYTAWQEIYTGIMDPRVLAWCTLEHCREMAERYPENTLVLLDRAQNDQVAGFTCYCQQAREIVSVADASEIAALYLLRAYQGRGLGRLLLEQTLAHLPGARTAVFVLESNRRAIGFYEHMGFRLTGHALHVAVNGGKITELEMVRKKG